MLNKLTKTNFKPQSFAVVGVSSLLKRNFVKYYTQNHEWIDVNGKETKSGISEKAAKDLGDIVYVELPEVGETFPKDETYGVIESVKAASDVYMPVESEIIEVNEKLIDDPGLVNQSAETEGWLIKVVIKNHDELKSLMNKEEYVKFCEQEEH
ncbi:glycine cleavage system h protein [Anaeramoeba flamelloides]|uniref:Glycine cleavage system H protein n=1 Tax=Anaeramoeba flamelloides TaxID=1746091 RepID=A0AAV7ZI70_9EUKA|nr:glycine cleavage system h protein [Anaeramoeba flamelloides]KAJ6237759.1 glycine cleavage system h protein [Anaeramoeba flamelloides]|eukprot:Anaeramoba_flamelloidesa1256_588.p1 GENE.a1256_588~~a1256_588.p1  ORF type:complete len:153 (-),score=43.22 a1256_588:4-462(-)